MSKEKKKVFKKVMLFDRYAGWSLAFSIMFTLALIWGLIYIIGYDPNQSYALQFGGEWFVIVTGVWFVMTAALFIINFIFGCIEINRARKTDSKKGILMYCLGMIIPYLGFSYHIDNRRTLIYIGNRLYKGGSYEANQN